MPSLAVHIDRSPFSARLIAWGRAYDGWWACVEFRLPVRLSADGSADELAVAAWIPARSVTKPAWSGTETLRRIHLGERGSWPAPPGWPSWYAGVWIDGPLPLPAGVTAVTEPAWRANRRRPRAGPAAG